MNKIQHLAISSVAQKLFLAWDSGVSVSFGKMAFAPKRIAFHILLAFGVFCLTVSGEKVTQVIFGQMGLSSTMYMGLYFLYFFCFE